MNESKRIDLSRQSGTQVDVYEGEVEQEHGNIVVAGHIRLNFRRFVKMLSTHDLTEVLERKQGEDQSIVIPADLLADISNSEMLIEKRAATTNIYSGIFIYGAGVGVLVMITIALLMQVTSITVAPRDLVIVGGIILAGLLLPFAIIATEPGINAMQEKHRDYLERVTSFLSRR